MGQITLQIPQSGQLFSTEGPKVATDMTTLQAAINGNLDTTNLSASAAIAATQLARGAGRLASTIVAGTTATAVSGQLLACSSGSATTVTLPAATQDSYVGVFTTNGVVTVQSSGGAPIFGVGLGFSSTNFQLKTQNSCVLLSADGSNWEIISGQQDTGWVALTPISGVATTSFAGMGTGTGTGYAPSARLQGDVVRLRGSMTNNTGGSILKTTAWTTLPVGMRPASTVGVPPYASSGGTFTPYATLDPSGNVRNAADLANLSAFHLDGITFPLG